MWLRLRQVCLVTRNLETVVASLETVFGIEVCHIDPAVGKYGLVNRLFPIGSQFLELVSPVADGTAAGRYLERRGGDGGYMVITQCDDLAPRRRRAAELGIRIANTLDHGHFQGLQLHPRDTGAAFFEMDCQGDDPTPDGSWHPAGPAWTDHCRTEVVTGIAAVELQSTDPRALGERWSAMAEVELTAGPVGAGGHSYEMALENATVRFVADRDGRGDSLSGLDLVAADGAAVRAARAVAGARGLLVSGGVIEICGVRFSFR